MSEALPKAMYQKHGAYYLVIKNKWVNLGKELPDALLKYEGIKAGTISAISMQKRRKPEYVEDYLIGLPCDIVARSIPRPIVGIYFLIIDDQISYIGQSMNVMQRIGTHASKREFDRYYYFECAADHLDEMEAKCIHKFNPSHNLVRPDIRRFKTKARKDRAKQ